MSDYGRRGLRNRGENCLKHLKRRSKRKEGKGKKDFKKGVSWVKEWMP